MVGDLDSSWPAFALAMLGFAGCIYIGFHWSKVPDFLCFLIIVSFVAMAIGFQEEIPVVFWCGGILLVAANATGLMIVRRVENRTGDTGPHR